MLPHQGGQMTRKPKKRRARFSLTLNPLQNHASSPLQDYASFSLLQNYASLSFPSKKEFIIEYYVVPSEMCRRPLQAHC